CGDESRRVRLQSSEGAWTWATRRPSCGSYKQEPPSLARRRQKSFVSCGESYAASYGFTAAWFFGGVELFSGFTFACASVNRSFCDWPLFIRSIALRRGAS